MLTARMDSGAMEAPGRMLYQIGGQTQQSGEKVLEFGIQQFKIGAEAEAKSHESQIELELAEAEIIATSTPNPANGQEFYTKRAKKIQQKYAGKVGSRYGRSILNEYTSKSVARGLSSVIKKNHQRTIDLAFENGKSTIRKNRIIIGDKSKSLADRESARDEIANTWQNLLLVDPKKAAGLYTKFLTGTVSDHIINAVEQAEDPVATARNFIKEGVSDDIVKEYYQKLTQSEIGDINKAALIKAEKMVVESNKKSKADEKAAEDELHRKFRAIINPETGAETRKTYHEELLKKQYYTMTRWKELAGQSYTQDLEGVDQITVGQGRDGQDDKDRQNQNYAELTVAAAKDELTLSAIISLGVSGLGDNYVKAMKLLEKEFGEAKKSAYVQIKTASKYNEHSVDDSEFTHGSRASYNTAINDLDNWLNDNPTASATEIRTYTKRLTTQIDQEMRIFMEDAYNADYVKIMSNILPNFIRAHQGFAREISEDNITTKLKGFIRSNPDHAFKVAINNAIIRLSRYRQFGFGEVQQ